MKLTEIRTLYADPDKLSGKTVKVGGWARNIRSSNAFGFIEFNDGTFFKPLQVVVESETLNNYTEVVAQNIGASFIIEGVIELTPNAKQPFEMKATKVEITGESTPDYPIQPKRHTLEYLRTVAHLRPRTNMFSAVFRIRSVAAQAIHSFFAMKNFVYVNTPIITGSDAEGAGEMFRLTTLDMNNIPKTEDGSVDYSKDFFGKETNLTVSGQLEAECFALAFSNVYTFGPTFRAENSNTPRHAAEFWMVEPEISFADLEDDMQLAEEMTKYVVKYVMEKCPEEITFFNNFVDKTLIERLENLVNNDFGRITYTEAIELMQKSGKKFDYNPVWGCNIQTEHERYISEEVFKKPAFITDYPKEIKSFYMRQNDDGKTVAAMDMVVPGIGELIGGSQREERLDVLEQRIKELGLNKNDYWWYLELRKYGGTKHAGYGIGFERLIMYITGMSNIRDVQAFSRTTGNAEF
ncbi:asparagine--tRNA ligase [Eubacteriales bacterium OttesenSCG-928-G02]|nr:asparagine--tRNA ligase [Eubacteriales bacterium OttesenSCG-928-G02]